jgi:protein-S-isoprenylcysteine O-methyltransferase Ste14
MPLGEMENKVAVSRRTVAQAVVVRDFAVAALIVGLAILFAILSATGLIHLRRPHLVFVISLVVAVLGAAWIMFQHIRMPRSRQGLADAQRLASDVRREQERR